VFSDPKLPFRTEQRSYTKTFLPFIKNRMFAAVNPPEGLEITPDILAQNFLEISNLTATGAGSAGPSQEKVEFFWRFERAGERTGWFAGGVMG
jgi:hypothetical protein